MKRKKEKIFCGRKEKKRKHIALKLEGSTGVNIYCLTIMKKKDQMLNRRINCCCCSCIEDLKKKPLKKNLAKLELMEKEVKMANYIFN